MFDWRAFLEAEGIRFISEGKNVKRGNVNIPCPFCGDEDPSEHMGLSLQDGRWGCLRNASHRGSNPSRLIQVLKGCDKETAESFLKDDYSTGTQSLEALARQAAHLGRPAEVEADKLLEFPACFRMIDEDKTPLAFDYLRSRKFHAEDIPQLVRYYGLRYARTGDFKGRVIIPLVRGQQLLGWTGRHVNKDAYLRYLSYPDGHTLKRLIWNYDNAAKGGDTLVITEGPLDGMKMDVYGGMVRAISLLTAGATPEKIAAIVGLSLRFRRVYTLLDREAVTQSLHLAEQLALARVKIHFLEEAKDPGDLTPGQVRRLCQKIR